MPVPTAEAYDKQEALAQSNGTTHLTGANCSSSTESNGHDDHQAAGSSTESGQALSKEEADRLYEERMEEEYAKREGGA